EPTTPSHRSAADWAGRTMPRNIWRRSAGPARGAELEWRLTQEGEVFLRPLVIDSEPVPMWEHFGRQHTDAVWIDQVQIHLVPLRVPISEDEDVPVRVSASGRHVGVPAGRWLRADVVASGVQCLPRGVSGIANDRESGRLRDLGDRVARKILAV